MSIADDVWRERQARRAAARATPMPDVATPQGEVPNAPSGYAPDVPQNTPPEGMPKYTPPVGLPSNMAPQTAPEIQYQPPPAPVGEVREPRYGGAEPRVMATPPQVPPGPPSVSQGAPGQAGEPIPPRPTMTGEAIRTGMETVGAIGSGMAATQALARAPLPPWLKAAGMFAATVMGSTAGRTTGEVVDQVRTELNDHGITGFTLSDLSPKRMMDEGIQGAIDEVTSYALFGGVQVPAVKTGRGVRKGLVGVLDPEAVAAAAEARRMAHEALAAGRSTPGLETLATLPATYADVSEGRVQDLIQSVTDTAFTGASLSNYMNKRETGPGDLLSFWVDGLRNGTVTKDQAGDLAEMALTRGREFQNDLGRAFIKPIDDVSENIFVRSKLAARGAKREAKIRGGGNVAPGATGMKAAQGAQRLGKSRALEKYVYDLVEQDMVARGVDLASEKGQRKFAKAYAREIKQWTTLDNIISPTGYARQAALTAVPTAENPKKAIAGETVRALSDTARKDVERTFMDPRNKAILAKAGMTPDEAVARFRASQDMFSARHEVFDNGFVKKLLRLGTSGSAGTPERIVPKLLAADPGEAALLMDGLRRDARDLAVDIGRKQGSPVGAVYATARERAYRDIRTLQDRAERAAQADYLEAVTRSSYVTGRNTKKPSSVLSATLLKDALDNQGDKKLTTILGAEQTRKLRALVDILAVHEAGASRGPGTVAVNLMQTAKAATVAGAVTGTGTAIVLGTDYPTSSLAGAGGAALFIATPLGTGWLLRQPRFVELMTNIAERAAKPGAAHDKRFSQAAVRLGRLLLQYEKIEQYERTGQGEGASLPMHKRVAAPSQPTSGPTTSGMPYAPREEQPGESVPGAVR